MKENNLKKMFMFSVLLGCCFISGCGKEKDPEAEQVLEITIAPELTPTPDPSEIDPAAVVTSGNLTMVNEYLAENGVNQE